MTTSGKASSPASGAKADAWKGCRICRSLPIKDSYDVFNHPSSYSADFSALEKLDEYGFDEQGARQPLRCPLCFTHYLETGKSDPDHYLAYDLIITRISDEQARQELAAMKGEMAKAWLADISKSGEA